MLAAFAALVMLAASMGTDTGVASAWGNAINRRTVERPVELVPRAQAVKTALQTVVVPVIDETGRVIGERRVPNDDIVRAIARARVSTHRDPVHSPISAPSNLAGINVRASSSGGSVYDTYSLRSRVFGNRTVPLRNGEVWFWTCDGWGFRHIACKHPELVNGANLIRWTVGSWDSIDSSKKNDTKFYKCFHYNGNLRTVRVVANFNAWSDGKPKGIITAHWF